jgi:hypothetical protein
MPYNSLPIKYENSLIGKTPEQTAQNVCKSMCSISTLFTSYPYELRNVLIEMTMGRPIGYVLGATVDQIYHMFYTLSVNHVVFYGPSMTTGVCYSVEKIQFFRDQMQKSVIHYFDKYNFLKS